MNIQKMMQQAQSMQKKMEEAQEKIASSYYVGEAGGGLVKVSVNGHGKLQKVEIDPSLLAEDEKETVEDLIVAAYNNAMNDAKADADATMGDVAGGLGLPPGFKMPF